MHFVLVGPGALGCLLSSLLSAAGSRDHHFTLLDHDDARAETLTTQGIVYQFKQEKRQIAIQGSSSPTEIGRADVIILCVKSYDIENCLRFCSPLLGPATLLLFMQNGVAHLDVPEPGRQAIPAFGTTTEGATLLAPGKVRHAGKGLTQLGFLEPPSATGKYLLHETAALFNQAGLTTKIRQDILARLWTKLLINTGINGLTATLGCTNGQLLDRQETKVRMERLVREAQMIAAESNIEVPEDAFEITCDVCMKTHGNISSMLQDVRSHRRTEIDAINGAVVAQGRKLGLEAPENLKLVHEVKQLEQTYLNK